MRYYLVAYDEHDNKHKCHCCMIAKVECHPEQKIQSAWCELKVRIESVMNARDPYALWDD
jgi:hypothetical protein